MSEELLLAWNSKSASYLFLMFFFQMMKEMNEVADQLRAQQVATATNHPNLPTLPEQEFKVKHVVLYLFPF